MLRALPPALLATTLLWVYFFAQPRGFLEYILIPVALPLLAIAIKRWIQSLHNPDPPLPKFAGDGPTRDPMRYLSVAATVIRITLLFVFSITLLYLYPGFSHWYPPSPGINVELALAVSSSPQRNAMREDVIMVSVERDSRVYFYSQHGGNEQIRFDELSAMINKSLETGSERRVYIKADRHVRYRLVKDVLDAVRSTRIENVTFLVEQVKPNSPVDEVRNVFRP